MRIKISIADGGGEGFMGIGLVWLLRRVKKFRSIRRAAQDMNLSYAKALKIINRLEANLGRKVLIRTRGGKDRGGAELTRFGERFIEEYDVFQTRIRRYAEEQFSLFKKKFPKKRGRNDR
jgi:molybdate transport system regulatory protein